MSLILLSARRQEQVMGKRLGLLPMNYLSQMSSSITYYMPLSLWLDNLPLSGGRIRVRKVCWTSRENFHLHSLFRHDVPLLNQCVK